MRSNIPYNGDRDPFVITPDSIIKAKLEFAELREDDILFDLGSGDAGVLIRAVQEYNVKAVGVELDEALVHKSREKILSLGFEDQIVIRQEDFLSTDVSEATILILYLGRNALGMLSMKLEDELQFGTRIITHQFDLPAWAAVRQSHAIGPESGPVPLYLYRK